jgi:hypothetical protein
MKDKQYTDQMEDAAVRYTEAFSIFKKYFYFLPGYIRKQIKTKLKVLRIDIDEER